MNSVEVSEGSSNREQSIIDDDDGTYQVEEDSSIVSIEDAPEESNNSVIRSSSSEQLLSEKAEAQAQEMYQQLLPTPSTASSSSAILIETKNLVSKIGGFEWYRESSPHENLEPLSMPSSVIRVQQEESYNKNSNNKTSRCSKQENASELLFETEEAIECFLPMEIDYHRDEIDENVHEDSDDDEILRIRNSFHDNDSLNDDDDDDDTLSCQSPTPMEPSTKTFVSMPPYYNIHDPKFQQAMDNFAIERHGFDHLVGDYVEGARTENPPVSSSCLSVVHEQDKESSQHTTPTPTKDSRNSQRVVTNPTIIPNVFTMEQVTLNDHDGLSSLHSLMDGNDHDEDVISNIEEDDRQEDSQLDLISTTAVLPNIKKQKSAKKTRKTPRQVLFVCLGNDNHIRTEMLGPPLKPASEMSKTEKKTLWWSNSDYRCFRKDFICGVEEGFDTGFMCSPFRTGSVRVATKQ